MNKDDLIKNLHELYRNDDYIKAICNSAGITLDNIESIMTDLEDQYWIDTATWGLSIWEKILNIKSKPESSYEDRRSLVEAKWRGTGKADIELLQTVANSWRNGSVLVEFVNGKIKLTFNGNGIPNDLDVLQLAIEDVKPAHLAIVYILLMQKDIGINENIYKTDITRNTKLGVWTLGNTRFATPGTEVQVK